jgi:acyl-CoA thioesterase-2
VADSVDRLIELLTLEPCGDDRYESPNPDRGFGHRVFGGQVAAQALRSALYTIGDDRHVHSMHAYFLRPGVPGQPIRYEVDRIRDGRSFTTRRVVAWQDEPIFSTSISFHVPEPGVDYQQPIGLDVPTPEDAPDDWGMIPDEARDLIPIEFKELGPTEPDAHGFFASTRRAWMRIKRELPDDPDLHAAMIAYLSDMGAVMGARAPLPEQPLDRLMGASLDHSLWFHRPLRADEWFLYDLRAISNSDSRGLAVGTLHAADGTLGVSVAQEAMLRVIDRARAASSMGDAPERVAEAARRSEGQPSE